MKKMLLPNGLIVYKQISHNIVRMFVSLDERFTILYGSIYRVGATNVIKSEQWIIGDYWDSVFSTE